MNQLDRKRGETKVMTKSLMAEGQTGNKRKIGTGMKPPGNKRVKPQKEKNQVTEQSTTEGHETPSKEAVLEGREGNEKGGTLEPENGENLLQNLENAQSAVAPMVALDGDLEAAMYRAPQSRLHCPLIPGHPFGAIPNFGGHGFSVRRSEFH
jgi:hypothetical protein